MTALLDQARAPRHVDGLLLNGLIRYSSEDRFWLDGPHRERFTDHRQRYGDRPRTSGRAGADLLTALDQVALTGRGGAHFPTATKWRTVLAAGGRGYVIANAAEGEPASAKDTALLQHRPHLVLDGLACAGEALSAIGSVIWVHAGATETHQALTRALRERRAARLVEPPVQLITGPDHYLTGESSAVVRGLSGGPALPTFNQVPTARQGLDGLPTLIQNVDTLARIALIARTGTHGPAPGTLVTILDDAGLTVGELPPHTNLADAVQLTHPPGHQQTIPQAVLLGGYGGTWLNWRDAAHLTISTLDSRRLTPTTGPHETQPRLTAVAGPTPSLGAGIIAPLPPDACGISETAALLDYLARSSARQCGPCLFGTRELADTMARIARGTARGKDIDRLQRLTGDIDGRGACALPDGAAQLTRSALSVFATDIDRHINHRECLHPSSRAILPIPGRAPS